MANWDFGVGKKFNVSEKNDVDFRAEFFDFTNHLSSSLRLNNIPDPDNFGKIFGPVNIAGIVEFTLK